MSDSPHLETMQTLNTGKMLHTVQPKGIRNAKGLLNWVDMFDVNNTLDRPRAYIRKVLNDPQSHWYAFINHLWMDIDGGVLETFLSNAIIHGALIGANRARRTRAAEKCNVPCAILMDPGYGTGLEPPQPTLSYDEMNSVIWQGKVIGTFLYLYGGESLARRADILRLCRAHPDCLFACVTDGVLVDEALAGEMLLVKNLVPILHMEGDEVGAEVSNAALDAMRVLKKRKLLFGVSCCYTSANAWTVGSDDYMNLLIQQGSKFALYYAYIPVGTSARTDLLATPKQREYMLRQIESSRRKKPLFLIDFSNDGEHLGGCVAAGRAYLHINAAGDIQPCVWIRYADANIREHTLLEALNRPLFKGFQAWQPFNHNPVRPCPLLDNAGDLAALVRASHAHATDLTGPESVSALCGKCADACYRWAPLAAQIWAKGKSERLCHMA